MNNFSQINLMSFSKNLCLEILNLVLFREKQIDDLTEKQIRWEADFYTDFILCVQRFFFVRDVDKEFLESLEHSGFVVFRGQSFIDKVLNGQTLCEHFGDFLQSVIDLLFLFNRRKS